ncbi:MAG: DNA-directed RNA polymerase subunit beta' [Acidobacteriota bacterium]|nr:MAG: DNA-directed RNA polymerase subunit beta' [Acidobacteriota bacterium]
MPLETQRTFFDLFRSAAEREGPLSANDYTGLRIGLASPEKIRVWSRGEVTKSETINYRTLKPEKDGLFCAKIFGPVNDWECLCGKYKRMKHRGIKCDKCGVEVTRSRVRRERMGHIELATPVSHVWFVKSIPSRIGVLLDLTGRALEEIIYFEKYVVVDPADTDLKFKQLLSEEEYRDAREEWGNAFVAAIGAEAIKQLLGRLNVDELAEELQQEMRSTGSKLKVRKAARRLRVVEAFRQSGNKPEWMVFDVLPVLPPDMRPLVPLDGGRFASSDLNDLYRKVITRNNRLKRLIQLSAPEVIVRNEKRMLQEAVDALFDNGRRGRAYKGTSNRPLRSLSDAVKGKQGRFRQNLLGKRVDYSGRSVVVVGPELNIHQCGLPKVMALELFKPFIYNRLMDRGDAITIKQAKEIVERRTSVVWDMLDEVTQGHPVLLNRAPTLHRLGIQAFEPVLVEGKAIHIHPLVCAAFNADFDGDQMAVHVPLSVESQAEAKVLMLSSRNILSPATGRSLAVPSQDMVLGIYYLTYVKPGCRGEGCLFASVDDVLLAYEGEQVETHTKIRMQYTGELMDLTTVADDQDILHVDVQVLERQAISTTVGQVILNSCLPEGVPYINGTLRKKGLAQLANFCYLRYGAEVTVAMLDSLKALGFSYATKSGTSIGIDDHLVPETKEVHIQKAYEEVHHIEELYRDGLITWGERYNRIIDIWSNVTERVSREMYDGMRRLNPVTREINPFVLMTDSGARGNPQQVRQLAAMRGLMAKPSGEIIETPITSNFREGLNVLEYFISTHGARKGLADTALKTANSGYLTRRLVDVAQDLVIAEEDCGTLQGIHVSALVEGGEIIAPLRERILGRVALRDAVDVITGEVLCKGGQLIDEDIANRIQECNIERVEIRSVLTCESLKGVCRLCYGRNLATGELVELGEAVGIVAAQSIGEPGTQLTMRTFHIGGTASQVQRETKLSAKNSGFVKFRNLRTLKDKAGHLVVMSRSGGIVVEDRKGLELESYPLVYGARLLAREGQEVARDARLAEWDPFSQLILTECDGEIRFRDLIEGVTVEEEVDERTGHARLVVMESPRPGREPQIVIVDNKGNEIKSHLMPAKAYIRVKEKQKVSTGEVLAKIPREVARTKDITGGLPRVEELFEAREPKDAALISEINGTVRYGEVVRNVRRIVVENEQAEKRLYNVPRSMHLLVQDGERVQAGDALTDGPKNPHDILAVLGVRALQEYIVNEIQEVYRLQGVEINDKHIECIARQMLRWVELEEPGDSEFLVGDRVDRFHLENERQRVLKEKKRPPKAKPLLLGITKAGLNTESFISAASFQETTRVLTEAAVAGKVDSLKGLKENVIMGRLIPAGTGIEYYRHLSVDGGKIEDELGAAEVGAAEEEAVSVDVEESLED